MYGPILSPGNDASIQNGQIQLVKNRGRYREYLIVLACIDENLSTASLVSGADKDKRWWLIAVCIESNGVPDDFFGVITQEVFFTENVIPYALGSFSWDTELFELVKRLLLDDHEFFILLHGVSESSAEHPSCLFVKLLEEGVAPRIPKVRVGGADVGNCKQVEVIQRHLIADGACKCVNDVGVADVLALRGQGHQEVVLNDPANPLGICLANAVLATKVGRDFCAEC